MQSLINDTFNTDVTIGSCIKMETISSEESILRYYTSTYWEARGDALTSTFPGMKNPIFFFLLSLNLSLLIKYVIPAIMVNRKAIDIKPWALVINGFGFGSTLSGMILLMSFTPAMKMTMNCHSYKPVSTDLAEIVFKYIAYLFIYTKLFDYIKPVLSALAKKENAASNLQLLQLQACVMFCWFGAKLNPGGVFILFGLLDTIYQVFVYGYLVFAAASTEMQLSLKSKLIIKNLIRHYRWSTAAFAVPYNVYFLLQSDCPNFDMGLISVIYIGSYVILYPFDIRMMQAKEILQVKLE